MKKNKSWTLDSTPCITNVFYLILYHIFNSIYRIVGWTGGIVGHKFDQVKQ